MPTPIGQPSKLPHVHVDWTDGSRRKADMSIDTENAPKLLRTWTTLAIDQDTQGAEKALHLAADVIETLLAERDAAHAAGRKEALESFDVFELGQAALEPLLDRRGLREPLQGIKYDDPDIWEDLCRATGEAAIRALRGPKKGLPK